MHGIIVGKEITKNTVIYSVYTYGYGQPYICALGHCCCVWLSVVRRKGVTFSHAVWTTYLDDFWSGCLADRLRPSNLVFFALPISKCPTFYLMPVCHCPSKLPLTFLATPPSYPLLPLLAIPPLPLLPSHPSYPPKVCVYVYTEMPVRAQVGPLLWCRPPPNLSKASIVVTRFLIFV